MMINPVILDLNNVFLFSSSFFDFLFSFYSLFLWKIKYSSYIRIEDLYVFPDASKMNKRFVLKQKMNVCNELAKTILQIISKNMSVSPTIG